MAVTAQKIDVAPGQSAYARPCGYCKATKWPLYLSWDENAKLCDECLAAWMHSADFEQLRNVERERWVKYWSAFGALSHEERLRGNTHGKVPPPEHVTADQWRGAFAAWLKTARKP